MFQFNTKNKRLTLYGTAFILAFLVLSPFIITWGINTPIVKQKISHFIHEKTGQQIDASTFSLAIFPHPSLLIKKFIFAPDKNITVPIDFLEFNFDIRGLLQGNLMINQIILGRPELKQIPTQVKTGQFRLNVSVSRYIPELKKILALLPEHQTSVELRIKNAITPYFKQMDGSVVLWKKKEEIILNTTIKELKLKPAVISREILKAYPDLDSIEIDRTDLFASINGKGELQGSCTVVSAILLSKHKKPLLDSNRIEVSFNINENGISFVLPQFKLNHPAADISIQFQNSLLEKEARLQFTGTNIHVDPARQMSLTIFKNNTLVKNIFQILRTGFVPNIQVSFQGQDLTDLFGTDQFRLKGHVVKGSAAIPNTDLVVEGINADVHIQNGILDITAKSALIQNSKVDNGHLLIDLLNDKTVPFQGKFSLDLDLSQMGQTMISLLPDTLLAKELSLVHDVTGRSKANLGLLLEPGSSDLKVNIEAQTISASGIYDRIPGHIRIENIHFKYEPDMVMITGLNANIDDNQIVDVNTRIDFENDALINIQSGSAVIDLESIMPVLMSHTKTRQGISPVNTGTGKVHIDSLALSGPILKPELWKYELNGKTDGVGISTQLNQKQIEGLTCQFQFSSKGLAMKHIQARIHHLSWIEPFVEKKHLESILIPFDLENGHFQMKENDSFFQTDLKFPSGANLYIAFKGNTPGSFFPNTIKISDKPLSNASISFNTNKDKPLIDFKGRLNTASLNKVIRRGSFWREKMDAMTEGQSIRIQEETDSSVTITTPSIDLNSFFSRPEMDSKNRRLLPDKIIHFKADQLKIKKLTFTEIDSSIILDRDTSHIQLNNAFLCDLKTNGYIKLRKDSMYMDIPFETKNNDNIQNLISCLFKRTDLLDGHYSLTGNLKSGNAKIDLINTLNGAFILTAEKGRIYKLTLLSRILSVLNVSKFFKGRIPDVTQNGFAYNKIFLETQIKDSIIHLTRAVIDGQDMTLIFSGWIDPVKETLDLTCLVAPFKTIDLIIEKIPIINTMLSGRLVSVPVKASGNLFDPTVVPLHPSAVGEGLITMMSDILKTPVKLWDKIYGE